MKMSVPKRRLVPGVIIGLLFAHAHFCVTGTLLTLLVFSMMGTTHSIAPAVAIFLVLSFPVNVMWFVWTSLGGPSDLNWLVGSLVANSVLWGLGVGALVV